MNMSHDAWRIALELAGWKAGRTANPEIAGWIREASGLEWASLPPSVSAFFDEFGGLALHRRSGVSRALVPVFDFDPRLTKGEDERFEALAKRVQSRCFGIGEVDAGRFFVV